VGGIVLGHPAGTDSEKGHSYSGREMAHWNHADRVAVGEPRRGDRRRAAPVPISIKKGAL
jgi:hypothetical protein